MTGPPIWCAFLLVPGLSAPAGSAQPASARTPHLQVDLKVSAGPEIFAALRFRMDPGWHLYWQNPGDSGLPPEVSWELPEGWKAGPLEFPVPTALPSPEGLDYGHAGTFTLLARLTPPTDRPLAGTVKARLDWLACKEACIQGKATLAIRLGDPRSRMTAGELARERSRLPLGAHPGFTAGTATVRRAGDRWLIEVPLAGPAAASAVAFFPEALPGFALVHREVRIVGGILRIPVLPSGPDAHLDRLRGVLLLAGQGVALELPLPRAPAP